MARVQNHKATQKPKSAIRVYLAPKAVLTTVSVGQDYFILPVADVEGGEPLIQYWERVSTGRTEKRCAPAQLRQLGR
jgi:hypothetical protein